MCAGHRINHVAVRVRTEHLLHTVAGAESQVASCVEVAESPGQDSPREFMTVMTFHHGKPIEKESCQWQAVTSGHFFRNMTQPAFREGKDHVGCEVLHCLFQGSVGCHWPDEIFVIRDPCGESRAKSALSQPVNNVR